MSHSSRERRRRERNARLIALNGARSSRTDQTRLRWFLRHAKRDGRCAARGCVIRRGDEIVYRYEGRVTLCRRCAEGDELVWPQVRPSADWEWRRFVELRRKRKAGPAWMRESSDA